MTIVYYTFGKGSGHPYEGGWVKIAGEGGRACDQTFRALYPDKTPGLLNCSGRYTELEFLQTKMPEEGNYGAFCQAEHIQPGEVEHRMEAAVSALYEGTDANGGKQSCEPVERPAGAGPAGRDRALDPRR